MKPLPTRVTRLLALSAAAGLVPSVAVGQNDRILDTPTGWVYLYGATSTQIAGQVSGGFRPFGIEQVASGQYDTIFVQNSGSYAVSGASVTYGRTPASMEAYLNTNNLRLLDLEVYDNGSGSTLMTAITVPNSGGTSTPAWGWLYNTSFSAIVTWMNDNPTLRLIDLDVYTVGGTTYYSAVAVHNSGANAQGWWYYNNVTSSDITQALTTNGARLIQVDLVSAGSIITPARYACVMVSSNQGGGWWYPALTTTQVSSLLGQNGARLTTLKRYTNFAGQDRWAVAMVDNVNAQTRRMRAYMGNPLSDGSYGFMLKQVGGPVLAALNENFAFEPASMLKILHGTYAIRQCALGQDSLDNTIFVRDRCNPNECPDDVQCNPANEPLRTAIRAMLEVSDNNRTREIEQRYGRATLNSFAASRGLTNTVINHRLGCLCGNPFNSFSCVDATSLYEDIANGSLFSTAWRNTLFELMTDLDTHGYGAYPTLSTMITQEAAATSLTPGEVTQFRANVHFANKGGGYSCDGTYYRTDGAWASLPFKAQILGNYLIVPREYAIATFVHGNTSSTQSQIAYSAKEEILREQVRAALESWDAACTSPGFLSHPSNRSAPLGGQAAFNATVLGGGGNDYRWQHQVGTSWVSLSNATGHISGATTTSLTISNIVAADAGGYRLVVTADCGAATSNAATLTITQSCYANCDGSTTPPILNVNDFVCFQSLFASGNTAANCDGSTTPPVLNVNDFVCFQSRFAAGCP